MPKEPILLLHSVAGVIIFISGLLQIVLKKGGSRHRIIGHIYVYTWLILLLSGIYLGGLIITIIGVFGFYFTFTGSRIGHLKNNSIPILDKLMYSLGGIISIAMLYFSVTLFSRGEQSFSIILAVFGGIFLLTTTQDIFKYVLNKPITKQIYGNKDWYFEHFRRMCISFIAAVTAFTSIQNLFNNNVANFLAPTVIGSILIFIANNYYRKKLIK